MVKCPNCGADISEPDKSLKNNVFQIEVYTCKNCKHTFKVANEFVFLTQKLSVPLM